jgi:exopolyphosphatase/guanosine-5'-triphosphate,3'-diphosphate pyrophosphatase
MRTLGVADLGSNTARLVVFAYEPGRWFRITDGVREAVRLGAGLAASGRLTRGALTRALAAVELFSDYAGATGLDRLELLGTSALRDAENRDDFVAAVARLGHEVRVLSGEEEAALGVLAVANGFAFEDAWVMDLGGGSAQLSLMRRRRYREGTDHPLGAVRLTEAFLRSDPPRAAEVRALEKAVGEELGGFVRRLDGSLPLVAMGGTIRNLARIAQKQQGYPLDLLHGYQLTRPALEEATAELLAHRLPARAEVPGLNADRADIIVAGALVFRWVLRRSRVESIVVSGHGVREGAFFRSFLEPPHLLPDVRGFSVRNRARLFPAPAAHVLHVRELAGRLFDELARLHRLGSVERELLDAAAVLHDSGAVLDYFRHDVHGAYLMTAAPLDGFSHRELALLALLVRYHRRGRPRLGAFKPLCRSGDRRRLLQLAVCLRLAESLERSRAGRVRGLAIAVRGGRVVVGLEAEEEPTIELWEASKHAAVFREAFGRRLVLEARVRRPARRRRVL